MAKLVICSVYDNAIQAFGMPFYVTHTGGAIRGFNDEISNPESQLSKHPDDFSLFELGVFDDATAIFETLDVPRLLIHGRDSKIVKN